jgi:hypothetical protein
MGSQRNGQGWYGLVVVALGLAACSAPRVGGQVVAAYLELDGDVGTRRGPLSTDNSADALGLDDPETVAVPRVTLDWDPLHVWVEGLQTEYDGTGVAEATLDLGGPVITVGEPVASDFDLGLYQARFVWDFVPDPLLDLGIGVGVGYLDYEITVRSLMGGGFVTGEDDLPFAFLAARAAKRIRSLEVVVQAGGGAIEVDDEDYEYLDFEALLTWDFWHPGAATVSLVLGYRYLEYEYEFDAGVSGEFDIDATLEGPLGGLNVRL